MVTTVNLYYDDEGWIVAYFAAGAPSSRAWQAIELNPEIPQLTDLSRTTLLDAINDVLLEVVGATTLNVVDPRTPAELGYFHWQHPTATHFLMIGTARGTGGSDFVSFAVPASFNVLEMSIAQFITYTDNRPCNGETHLDGDRIHTNCPSSPGSFLHTAFPALTGTAHTLEARFGGGPGGGLGSMVMLIYALS